jgi:rare lipoprotein A
LTGGTYLGLAKAGQPEPSATQAAPTTSASPSAQAAREERPEALSRDFERTPSPSAPSTPASARVTQSGSCGASFYDEPQGTASGEVFNPEDLTAAHKTLPFNSKVRVTNPATGKSVTVRINDRGPYIDGRCLDLSRAAFRAIADLGKGVLSVVNYEVLAS